MTENQRERVIADDRCGSIRQVRGDNALAMLMPRSNTWMFYTVDVMMQLQPVGVNRLIDLKSGNGSTYQLQRQLQSAIPNIAGDIYNAPPLVQKAA